MPNPPVNAVETDRDIHSSEIVKVRLLLIKILTFVSKPICDGNHLLDMVANTNK